MFLLTKYYQNSQLNCCGEYNNFKDEGICVTAYDLEINLKYQFDIFVSV